MIRVWDALTGVERNVTYDDAAPEYLRCQDLNSISTLTLADYTLIANQEREVSLSEVALEDVVEQALVVVNAITYNTSYSIDLSRDGDTEPVKAYRAKAVEVTPGSFEVADGGSCGEQFAQDFLVMKTGRLA